MVNYQNGKIYKIVSNTDDDICYVGSTTKKYLSQRIDTHRYNYKNWKNKSYGNTSVFKLFEKYGFENCRIELLELVPCNSKDELLKKEGEHIKALNCVNKNIMGRTKREYYDENKDIILEKNKKYREENKEQFIEKAKLYRQEHKEEISEKEKEKYTCCCGSTIVKHHKSRHEKTKKHIDFISSQDIL